MSEAGGRALVSVPLDLPLWIKAARASTYNYDDGRGPEIESPSVGPVDNLSDPLPLEVFSGPVTLRHLLDLAIGHDALRRHRQGSRASLPESALIEPVATETVAHARASGTTVSMRGAPHSTDAAPTG